MGEEARAVPLVGGRYELETLLGKGGVGEVWRARHVTLETHVAIKFLHGPSADSDVSRKRFVTEARVAAQLKTPYAVKVFDCGVTDEGRPYLVMDLLEGETLGHRLKRVKRLSPEATVRFLARALARHRPPRFQTGQPPHPTRRGDDDGVGQGSRLWCRQAGS